MTKMNNNIPSGYKPSPLGPIPEDWEVKRLGEIITVNSGKDYKHLNNGNIPVYGTGGYMLSVDDKLSDIDAVGIGRKGTIDKPQYLKAPFWTVDTLFFLTTKNGNEIEFVFCLSQMIKWKKYSEQTGVPSLTRTSIDNIEIPVPPLTEQQRIVSVLSLWDTAISKQTALIEKLTLRKRGLMQQLLTGKKRLKGFGGEWKEVRLGEIGTFFKGNGVPKDSILSEGHKCLTYGDLYTKYDYVISNVQSFIDDNTANISTKIQYGDICFAGSGETKEDIGKCAAFIDDQYGYAGGDIIVFRAEGCNPITLSYILNSDSVIRQKSNMGQGHSVVHIYPYQLERITITILPIEEQNAIATVLVKADKEIEIANKKLARLQEEKKGLMQVLLTGKRRVK